MYPEKRAYKRFDSNLFISYSLLNEMGTPVLGGMTMALNISRNGIMIENRNQIDKGEKLELMIAVGNETIKVRGIVRHVESEQEQFRMGIEFVDLAPDVQALIDKFYTS